MKKMKLSAFAALVGALIAVLAIAPPASAAPAANGVTLPATCTDAAGPVSCTLQLVGFTTQNGVVAAVLRVTNNVTGATQTIVASLVPGTQQQAGTCTLLDLTIQPIDLDLLGLHLHTDTIHFVLTAQRGDATWRPALRSLLRESDRCRDDAEPAPSPGDDSGRLERATGFSYFS
jgi:hypothetical protein